MQAVRLARCGHLTVTQRQGLQPSPDAAHEHCPAVDQQQVCRCKSMQTLASGTTHSGKTSRSVARGGTTFSLLQHTQSSHAHNIQSDDLWQGKDAACE